MKYKIILLLISLLFFTGCPSKTKITEKPGTINFKADLSGEYVTVHVEEILGTDPLGGSPFTITVQKEKNFYIFIITHRDKVISKMKKPYLDREFPGMMEEADSKYILTRTLKGLSCEVMANSGTYHFIVYLEKKS